jgi:hypothetical protein
VGGECARNQPGANGNRECPDFCAQMAARDWKSSNLPASQRPAAPQQAISAAWVPLSTLFRSR